MIYQVNPMDLSKLFVVTLLLAVAVQPAASKGASFPGDDAFARCDYPSAERQYDSVLAVGPPNAELLWHLARLHIAMGDASEENERGEHYRAAGDFAKKCISLDSTSSEGFAWLAASLGNEAMEAGGKRKVQLANEIKKCLDRSVALDSTNDIAWSILGTFYRALGGVSWIERQLAKLLLGSLPEGGYTESEQAFRRAIAIAPQSMRHRFELALLYEAMDRTDEARVEYAACAALQPQMISDRRRLAKAEKWLQDNPDHSADKK